MTAAPTVVLEARSWLLDCGAEPDDVESWTDRRVLALIDYHYEGGLAAFLLDSGELDS